MVISSDNPKCSEDLVTGTQWRHLTTLQVCSLLPTLLVRGSPSPGHQRSSIHVPTLPSPPGGQKVEGEEEPLCHSLPLSRKGLCPGHFHSDFPRNYLQKVSNGEKQLWFLDCETSSAAHGKMAEILAKARNSVCSSDQVKVGFVTQRVCYTEL